MAVTLTATRFPNGTVVGAYFRGQAGGDPVDTATVTQGRATFTNLPVGHYVAGADLAGVWRETVFNVTSSSVVAEDGVPSPPIVATDAPYGAVGDGVADDSLALRAAVADARTQGRPLYIPGGRYLCLQTLTQSGQTGPLVVQGYGRQTVLEHGFGTVFAPAMFEHSGGSIGSAVEITANVAAGAETLQLATAGLSPNDFLALRDLANVQYGTSTNQGIGREGEVVRIKTVDSGTQVTLWGSTEEAYTRFTGTVTTTTGGATESFTNDNLDARLLTLVEGHSFKDFTIESLHDPADADFSTRGFQGMFSFSRGFRAENVHFRNIRSDGFRGEFALGYRIDRCSSEGGHVEAHYMVQARQGSTGVVSACEMREGRHLFTTGDQGDGIPPRHNLIAYCKTYGTQAAGFDTHGNGKHTTFLCPEVNGGSDIDAGQGDVGVQIRSKNATVIEPKVNGRPFYGVAFYAGATNGRLVGGDIRGSDTPLLIQYAENVKITGKPRIFAPAGITDAVRVERAAGYNVAMENLDIDGLDIVGEVSDPATNGVNFTASTWQSGFKVRNVDARNVVTKITGMPQDRLYGALTLAAAKYQTLRRADVPNATIDPLSSGRLTLVGLDLPVGELFSLIGFFGGTAETTPTNLWYALYDSALAKLGVTEDLGSTPMGLTVPRELALATPVRTTYPGLHYLGITSVAAAVGQLRGVGVSSNLALRPPAITGHGDTGLTDPASAPATASALTANALMPYAYIA